MAIQTGEELISAFGLRDLPGYEAVTPFIDSIGFSVQRPYPEDCKFKPARDRSGNPNHVCLIRVGFDQSAAGRAVTPLFVDVGVFNRWLARHIRYDFDDPACPTPESVARSNASPRPTDLIFWDDYLYDVAMDRFQDSEGKVVKGPEILNEVFQAHLGTLSKRFRAKKQLKRTFRSSAVFILNGAYNFTMSILWFVHGIRLSSRTPYRSALDLRWEDFERVSEKEVSITIFGYPIAKRTLYAYSMFVMVAVGVYDWFGGAESGIGKLIHGNVVLSTIAALLLLCFFDQTLPVLFRYMAIVLVRLRAWVLLPP